jgi:hypothetical protein
MCLLYVGQQLGSRLVSAGPGLRLSALRVGYLVREGQNVALVTNLVREAHGNVWPASAIYNTWADTPKLEDMVCKGLASCRCCAQLCNQWHRTAVFNRTGFLYHHTISKMYGSYLVFQLGFCYIVKYIVCFSAVFP